MSYVTKADYDAYSDVTVSAEDFPRLSELASDLIDGFTMNRITAAGGLDSFPPFVQDRIKKATCAQVQTIAYAGSADSVVEDVTGGGITSESLGKYSYSKKQGSGAAGNGEGGDTVNGIELSPLVRVYLRPTGLLFRGLQKPMLLFP
ncbi:MAG: hypothetical protein PHS57_10575 [Alphaproteobacteria bacterium]|nr:hypothetical protein [Alphaproteobacteria bacterium]